MTFNNRTAVITGAAGRIGRGTAREFARHGVKLYLADIDGCNNVFATAFAISCAKERKF